MDGSQQAYRINMRDYSAKKTYMLTPEYRGTTRRVYAAIFRDPAEAKSTAAEISRQNPDVTSWAVTWEGRRI